MEEGLKWPQPLPEVIPKVTGFPLRLGERTQFGSKTGSQTEAWFIQGFINLNDFSLALQLIVDMYYSFALLCFVRVAAVKPQKQQ